MDDRVGFLMPMASAEQEILRLIAEGVTNVVPLMKAASKHVNTMTTDTRMALREFIKANGGSLVVNTTIEPVCDVTLRRIKIQEPTEHSCTFAQAAERTNVCLWPVGLGDKPNHEDNLCCGVPIPSIGAKASDVERLAEKYCNEHKGLAIQPGTSVSRNIQHSASSSRINRAAATRIRRGGSPKY